MYWLPLHPRAAPVSISFSASAAVTAGCRNATTGGGPDGIHPRPAWNEAGRMRRRELARLWAMTTVRAVVPRERTVRIESPHEMLAVHCPPAVGKTDHLAVLDGPPRLTRKGPCR